MSDSCPNDIFPVKRETMAPQGDRVLLKMEETKQVGKIIIPRGAKVENTWFGKVLAKGKGPNADYVPVGARVIVKKMFLMEGSNVGRGTNGYECSEHDIEHGDCLMIDADHILAVCDDD